MAFSPSPSAALRYWNMARQRSASQFRQCPNTLRVSASDPIAKPANPRPALKAALPDFPLRESRLQGDPALTHRRPTRTPAPSAELEVRIQLPPADSQSLSRSRFGRSRTPAFRAGLGGCASDRVSRDAPGCFHLRTNRRQYLCRAIFQYRSAADGVGENATPVPIKSGAFTSSIVR